MLDNTKFIGRTSLVLTPLIVTRDLGVAQVAITSLRNNTNVLVNLPLICNLLYFISPLTFNLI